MKLTGLYQTKAKQYHNIVCILKFFSSLKRTEFLNLSTTDQHFGPGNSLLQEAFLWIVGCLAAHLVSTH